MLGAQPAGASCRPRGFPAIAVDALVARTFPADGAVVSESLRYVRDDVVPASTAPPTRSATCCAASTAASSPPARAAPRRAGMANILPTGRNFYSIDTHTIPHRTPGRSAQALATRCSAKYLAEEGAYPERSGIVVWGTSTMRTHGDDVAEILT